MCPVTTEPKEEKSEAQIKEDPEIKDILKDIIDLEEEEDTEEKVHHTADYQEADEDTQESEIGI